MSLSGRTTNVLGVALADKAAAKEVVAAINSAEGVDASPSTPVTPVAVTFTSGGTPSAYTSPTGAVTVAVSGTPTVVELLDYCNELRGNIASLQAILHAHGITT